jgi:FAD/FMN-containing dehydrogenase
MIPVEDASGYQGFAEREFMPANTAEVAEIAAEANRSGTPITIAGGRTGVTGGCCPAGGWLISMQRMNALEIQKGKAVAQAGVALKDLQAAAARVQQLYPPDPTEWTASVGGSIATNASGSRSFRYGATRRYVLAVEVVMADGSVRRFERGDAIDFDVPAIPISRARKNTAGYLLSPGMDWVDLFTGSEGTLGIVTEAALALLPAVADLLTGVIFFPSDDGALDAVDAWRPVEGLRMLEYLDAGSLDLLRTRFAEIPENARAALLIEQELAGDHETDAWIARLEASAADLEASWIAAAATDRERFRAFRHALPELVNQTVRQNGFMKMGSDFSVPIEANREMLAYYRIVLDREFAKQYVIFGHIGDAHLHVNLLPGSKQEFERGKELMAEFARQAVTLGGSVSAEHGLGKRKRELLALQYTGEQLEAMRAVKRRLDPGNILGRGNLFTFE